MTVQDPASSGPSRGAGRTPQLSATDVMGSSFIHTASFRIAAAPFVAVPSIRRVRAHCGSFGRQSWRGASLVVRHTLHHHRMAGADIA